MARRRASRRRSYTRAGSTPSKMPWLILGGAAGLGVLWYLMKSRGSTYIPAASPAKAPASGGLWQGVATQAVQAVQSGSAQTEASKLLNKLNPKNW